jgi:diguanylate cyclase (GGDEF)-like protein
MLDSSPLLEAIHVGVIVLNEELEIKTWNRWIAIHTGVSKSDALGKKINQVFNLTQTQTSALERRIRTAKKLKSPTFAVASAEKYLLPIPLPLSNHTNFTFMQQDATIVPYDNEHTMLLIYDQTPLMESRKREENKSRELEQLVETANETIKKLKFAEALLVKQRDVIYNQANYDKLTGLANRHLFEEKLAQLIENAKTNDSSFALLFLDLDNFKQINDTHGHDIGDKVLVEASKILKNSTRESDTLVRFGGDEFLILLNNAKKDGALQVSEKILKSFQAPISVKSSNFTLGSSIGIALYPKDASSGVELVQKADKALYKAKFQGRAQAVFYNEEDK